MNKKIDDQGVQSDYQKAKKLIANYTDFTIDKSAKSMVRTVCGCLRLEGTFCTKCPRGKSS